MVLAAVGEGNSAFAAGRYGDARRAYIRAVLLDENDGTAKFLYGLATFAEGDFGVAATAVRRALATTPDLIDYPFNVVSLYGNGAGFNEQLTALARYIGANPEDREAILLLAYLRYASGEAAEAQVVFGALADADPTDSLVVFLRDASTRAMQAGRAQPTQSPSSEQPAAPPDEFVP
jgi:Flp pilus assembly protein TadD